MNDEVNEADDLEWAQLLADYDDALAAGPHVAETFEDVVPTELHTRFEREIGWLSLVRHALGPIGLDEEPSWPAFAGVAPRGAAGRLGRFELRRELGRGAFGVVFLAYDPTLRREVALKVPRPESLLTAELRPVSPRGARRGEPGPPEHRPGVRRGRGRGDQLHRFSLQSGRDARRLAPSPRRSACPLPNGGAADLGPRRGRRARPPARGLTPGPQARQHLARTPGTGGSSRDALGFTPKITDFGLAKVLYGGADPGPADAPTLTGAILGTPSYMAPEQAEGRTRDVGRPADVHALGAILYELLTGRPPFKADSPLETLQVIRSREPVAPSRLRPGVPRDLETICLKCLQKDPRRRYPDAQALAKDLGRYLDGEAIAARPVGPLMRLALRCRRNPIVASTVMGALLAVMLVAGISVWRVVRERDRYRTERDRAEGNLYRALLGEARGQILARDRLVF